MDSAQLNRAIDVCYDAVFEPESWPDALHQLARAADAVCAMFYPENPSGRLQSVPASRDYGDFLDFYIRGGWYENHYRAERGWPLLKAGKPVVVEHDLASDEERRHLQHYNDLYLKWDFPGFACVGFGLDGQHWCVPLLRASSQGHFDHADAEHLAELAPHFRRMMKLSERLAFDRATAGLHALEGIGSAAIVVGPNGRVVGMNKNAERLLGNGLFVWNGFLDTADRNARDKLYRMIASTRAMDSASDIPCEPVIVRRPETRPLVLEAFPARGLLADVFQRVGALILVTDLAERPRPAPERLRSLLGLTPAEARLISRVCEGLDLAEAAQALGISIHTARSQIKSAFAKTGTKRQSELVALVVRL